MSKKNKMIKFELLHEAYIAADAEAVNKRDYR